MFNFNAFYPYPSCPESLGYGYVAGDNSPFLTLDMSLTISLDLAIVKLHGSDIGIQDRIAAMLQEQVCLDKLPDSKPLLRHPISDILTKDVIHKADLYFWFLNEIGIEVVPLRPFITMPINTQLQLGGVA